MQIPVCLVHVTGQSQERPIRLNWGYKLRERVPDGAYVQTFALLLGEEGTFPSVGWRFLAERHQGGALRAGLAHFASFKIVASLIGTADKSWHEACKCCYVHIGIGEDNG